MADSPFSASWYRVASLRPRLASGVSVSRHRYRGESWYLLRDLASGRVHRFTPATYAVIGQMDGRLTLEQIWQSSLERLGDNAPSQDELIQLLGQLHAADLIQSDTLPDTAEVFERHGRQQRMQRLSRVSSPLFIRVPLWDPDEFLVRWLPWVQWMWRWPGAIAWAALVLPALVLAGIHWQPLTHNMADRVLSVGNLALLWATFPVLKLLHELGHAFATRSRGAEVHEIGVMFMVLTPIPYVDSSAANVFRSRGDRALVGAAGMLVETAIASVAMFAWVLLEPGLLRALCFNVMLIAGISTVVFNLNPLLRYDGYFILCDLAEVPNLARRSQKFWTDVLDRRLFGSADVAPEREAPGERPWLALYAPLSSVYRLFVTLSIALFIATQYLAVGVVLALWGIAQGILWPALKGVWHVLDAPALARRRVRAVGTASALLTLALVGLLAIPAPHRIVAQGVVWLPEDAQLRTATEGFVDRLAARNGQAVGVGHPVIEIEELTLQARLAVQQAKAEEARARHEALWFSDRNQAELARQALESELAALQRLQEEDEGRIVATAAPGRLTIPRAADLPGRFVRKGELVGYVTQGGHRQIRVVVDQEDVDSIRGGVRAVQVRLAPQLHEPLAARLVREVPGGTQSVPSRALSLDGGGVVAMDPKDPDGRRTLNHVFQFDVELEAAAAVAPLGARAHVRFELDPQPIGSQAWRYARQLFLSRFAV